MTVWYTKGIYISFVNCFVVILPHHRNLLLLALTLVQYIYIWLLFYYWTSKLINLLLFQSFPNSHHLRTNFPNYKGPGPQIQMSWKITVRYIYYCNLQYLNNAIIDKTKVLLPRALLTLADFGYPVLSLWFHCFQNFKLLGFAIFRFRVYLMNGYFRNVSCALSLLSMFLLFYYYIKRAQSFRYRHIQSDVPICINTCRNIKY